MSIVVYRCDVCTREREFLQNINGLETIQRCTITHGCRGSLSQVNILPDHIRARQPEGVLGLTDWRQRRVLFNHTQTIASNNWEITHNLGTFPSISAFINIPTEDNPDNLIEIIPTDTIVVDENTMRLVFDRAVSGVAQLVARQSDPDLLRPMNVTPPATINLLQISNNGEITIGTRISTIGMQNCDIDLSVSFSTIQNTIIEHVYTGINGTLPGTTSPWTDFDNVIVRGQMFSVRSYQGIFPSILDDTIANGSNFSYTATTTNTGAVCGAMIGAARPIILDEVYLLLANTPFAVVDKITDRYVDLADVTSTTNQFALIYDSGEFFVDESIIRTTFPPIRNI